jgi:hypothetical protein
MGVALALATGIVALVLATDPRRSDLGALTPSEGATSSTSPSLAPDDSEEQPELPEDWTRYVDQAEGWSIGVPPGYERSVYRGSQIQFRDDAARRSLRIDYSADPAPSALQAAQAFSPQLDAVLGDYQELRVQEVDYKRLDAADLEFTYFDRTELRVLDRTVVSADGSAEFGLYWQVPASDWEDSLAVFEQIAQTFDLDA